MNILFLTLSRITSIEVRGIYTDLIRKFRDEGHELFIVSPVERRNGIRTKLSNEKGANILEVWTLNVQKTNIIEKAIGTLSIDYLYLNAIKKYFRHFKFDLILYSTPPITLTKVISKIKKRDGARSYLLLKDIFPQNAIDLGMMKQNGIIYKYFRKKEKTLYKISDYIGCMSPANVNYLKKNNPQIDHSKIEENPNSHDFSKILNNKIDTIIIRKEYNIPVDAIVFIYGGNLGKPQGLDFLLRVIESNSKNTSIYFVLAGSGTEFGKIRSWFISNNPKNALLMHSLPKPEYDKLITACDIGLIFLDPRFTIPNFPSRLLSYLENKMPVIAAVDKASDIGLIAEENGFGFNVLNGDLALFNQCIDKFINNKSNIAKMGEKGYRFMLNNYSIEKSYNTIISHLLN